MATRQTVLKRADLAANFQSWVTNPKQSIDIFESFKISPDEDMITVPAAPEGSAAVTLHRMERTGASVVVLVTGTRIPGRHRAVPFQMDGKDPGGMLYGRDVPTMELESGMTVMEWLDGLDDLGGVAQTLKNDSKFFAYLKEQMDYGISA